ncbi:DUF11 domain-containing protein [Methanobacterium aggregans]|uniref:DUF11 domain-containing protein n=1 Tax=Methanobacterium aggregans TaxID=1615586 RepID=UPI001AE555F0|nr:DUF11 domain-containing protein [Methanobacterium aggregans]MBP2046117.1 putative repeat protein (TIGR01451 family) [Methanobacterium aggregans]
MRKQIKPKAQVMFILLTIFAIMVSISSVSAASTVYVNATGGNDSNIGTIDHPYQTIAQGISSVDENGTVHIADGTYSGTGNTNITINKNMNINGQSQTGTIINGTDTNWIFHINSGVTATITNLTLTQGNATSYGGAIYNYGTLTVTNCTFTNNTATSFGGAIENRGSLVVYGSTFIKNIANGEGGGAIDNWSDSTTATSVVSFSQFINNGECSIYEDSGSVSADNNWWGSNNPVWANLISGMSNPTQWLYMTMEVTPTTINNTQTSLVTVSFNNYYNGTTVTPFNPSTGHIPDGTPVNLTSALGSFNPVITTTVNGIATALFTANQTGTGNLKAVTDNQTATELLTVNPAAYLYLNVTSSKDNPTVGETFVLTYKLSNSGPNNATNVTMSFQVPSGLEFVSASVDNGTWSYNPLYRTVTWNLTNVAVGDPYLYLTVKALGSGSYTIIPTITSDTYNRNTEPLTPFTVNVQAQNNSNDNTVNAASTTKTVPMQHTGMPIAGLITAILAIFGGMLPRRK